MPQISCNNCRRKKQKCGLERPECLRCRNRQQQCSYPASRSEAGPTKNTTLGRVLSLKDRIVRLETWFQEHGKQLGLADECYSAGNLPPRRSNYESQTRGTGHSSIGTAYEPSFSPTISELPLNGDLSNTNAGFNDFRVRFLLGVYFRTIQPMFPLFSDEQFTQDLHSGTASSNLVIVMVSLASRFSNEFPEYQNLGPAVDRIARTIVQNELSRPHVMLKDIKLACLCIIHQLGCGPKRETRMIMEALSRVVHACRLHTVDSQDYVSSIFPDATIEELRYVWWAVIRIDTFCNILYCAPFYLKVDFNIAASVGTSVADSAAAVESSHCLPHIICPMNASFWKFLQDRSSATFANGRWLHLSMYLLIRETRNLLRSATLNPGDQATEAKLLQAYEKCTRIRDLLPAWYKDPRWAVYRNEPPSRHRIRLETLMLLHMCCLYTVIPLLVDLKSSALMDVGSRATLLRLWDLFTSHLQAAEAVTKAMPPTCYCIFDPLMSTAIWIVGCMVCFCGMLAPQSRNFVGWSSSRQQDFEKSYDILRDRLAGFARMWKASRKMLESLERVRGWHGLQLQLNEVLDLLARLQVPFLCGMRFQGDPYEIDILSVCKDPSDQTMIFNELNHFHYAT